MTSTVTALQPGESWIGNSVADYPIKIWENTTRAVDIVLNNAPAIKLNVYNTDLLGKGIEGINAANPRVQLQSPQTLLTVGRKYTSSFEIQVPNPNVLIFTKAGWITYWQLQGYPFAGSPPMSWGGHDGKHMGFWEDGTPADGQKWSQKVLEPIVFGTWAVVEFDFVYTSTPSPLTVSYNGNVVYTTSEFAAIDKTNAKGPSMFDLDLYVERNTFTHLGPVYFRNHTLTCNS